jgi:hypothetical protein
MVFDAKDGYVLLWGGHNSSSDGAYHQPTYTMLNDSWKFLKGVWTQIRTQSAPRGGSEPTLQYDPAIGKVIEFDGYYQTGAPVGGYRAINQTWAYSDGVWTNLSLAVMPWPRDGAASAYDPLIASVVIFGGQDEGKMNECLMDDTWALSGSTSATLEWTQVYDAQMNEMVMFGGTGNTHGVCGGISTMDWFHTTWAFRVFPTVN